MPATAIRRDQEPPKCPYNNVRPATRHPDGLDSRTCPTCRARTRWVSALRWDRIKSGEHVAQPRTNRGARRNPELRKPVPKCGLRHPNTPERRTCKRCIARNRYTNALLRDERARGAELLGLVDAAEAVRHVTEVLVPSGLFLYEIADRAGVDKHMLGRALRGVHKKILAANSAAILSVQPRDYPTRGKGEYINATGTKRILQGLYAQGWMVGYMAGLIGMTLANLWQVVDATPSGSHKREFVSPRIADAVKRLRDKLGAFDLAQLDEPLDGMSPLCVTRATKRGFLPLDAWENLDIDDPRVKPHGHDALDDELDGFLVIEPQKIELALDDGEVRAGRRFPVLFTKAELYQFVLEASARGIDGEQRFSARAIAARCGVAERTALRMRAEWTRCRHLVEDAAPLAAAYLAAELVLATAELPANARMDATARILNQYPIGPPSSSFFRHLVVLALVHPAPYGRGWTDGQLAEWFGIAEEGAAEMRHAAVRAGREYYEPRHGSVGSARKIGFDLSVAA